MTLTILMYHAVIADPLPVKHWCFLDRGVFLEQLTHLKKRAEVVALGDVMEKRDAGPSARPAVALTFDDGFENHYSVVFNALRRENLPATFFLSTDLVGTDRTLWFCRLHRALTETKRGEIDWDGRRFDLSSSKARAAAAFDIQERLKAFDAEKFSGELERVLQTLGEEGDRPVAVGSPYRLLSRAQVREMAASGLVEFGAHGASHTILSRLPDTALRAEIDRSVAAVASLTGRPCRLFAYPNGRRGDYDGRVLAILQERGIFAAVTTEQGSVVMGSPPLELPRRGIGANTPLRAFRALLSSPS